MMFSEAYLASGTWAQSSSAVTGPTRPRQGGWPQCGDEGPAGSEPGEPRSRQDFLLVQGLTPPPPPKTLCSQSEKPGPHTRARKAQPSGCGEL